MRCDAVRRMLAAVLLLAGLAACATREPVVSLPDCRGEWFSLYTQPRRAIVTDAYAAQTMARLGLLDRIVALRDPDGLTADHPEWRAKLTALPILNGPRPQADLVVSSERPPGPDALPWVTACPPVLGSGDPQYDVGGLYGFVRDVGIAFGVVDRADALIREMRARVGRTTAGIRGKRVLIVHGVPTDDDLLQVEGRASLASGMVVLAGGINVTDADAEVTRAEAMGHHPEVVWLISDEKASFPGTTVVRSSPYAVDHVGPLNLDALDQIAAAMRRRPQ
ncbi:hypothetical protein [Actinoplanes sp. NPDC049265]|uniref:hypothetical protein n=1 Tax=Actinoplanes sp. NPDC049265 TaxID=3363902 RepID=UPI003712ADE8